MRVLTHGVIAVSNHRRSDAMPILTDVQWSAIEPLIEAVRPQTGRELTNLRRTVEAIVWRMQNGAKWRAIPAELGPWWMAAQTFSRPDLHPLVQARGLGAPLRGRQGGGLARAGHGLHGRHHPPGAARSEERRVGKECRSRWSPYH